MDEIDKEQIFKQLLDLAGVTAIKHLHIPSVEFDGNGRFQFYVVLKEEIATGITYPIEHTIFLGDSESKAALSPGYPIDVTVNDMQILLDIALANHEKIVFYTFNAFDYRQHILIPKVQCMEELLVWLDLNS